MTKTYKLYLGAIAAVALLLLILRPANPRSRQISGAAGHMAVCFTALLTLMTLSSRDIVRGKL